MLYLEILLSLIIWISTFTPFLLYSFSVRADNIMSKINQEFEASNDLFKDAINNSHYNNQNWCRIYAENEGDGPSQINTKEISGFSASNTPSYIATDGADLFIAFNSASTTDPDLIKFNVRNGISNLDERVRLDTGPGLLYLALNNHDVWGVNTSINSHFQRFKIGDEENYVNYKINSTYAGYPGYAGALYANTLSVYYPYMFVGLKKNSWNEFLAFRIDTSDFGSGFDSAQDNASQHLILHHVSPIGVSKFDSSIQKMTIVILRGVFRLFAITPSEPEIKIYSFVASALNGLNGNGLSGLNNLANFDIAGTLGNIRTVMWNDLDLGQLIIGRSQGNQELYKIDFDPIIHDSKTVPEAAATSTTTATSTPIVQPGYDFNSGVYSAATIIGRTSNSEKDRLLIVEGKTNPRMHIVNLENPNLLQAQWTETITGETTNIECLGNKGYFVKKDSQDGKVYLVEMIF